MQHGPGDSCTVGEALEHYYRTVGLPNRGGGDAPRWAPLAAIRLTLPNFAWRRRALPVHDLHHLLLGYPCSPSGEFEMAAWEFAAGRFRHPLATAFCLPLVGMGAVSFPRRTFAAFVRGRASRTLYESGLTPELLTSSIDALRQRILPAQPRRTRTRDAVVYLAWVAASLAWILAPFALVALSLATLSR